MQERRARCTTRGLDRNARHNTEASLKIMIKRLKKEQQKEAQSTSAEEEGARKRSATEHEEERLKKRVRVDDVPVIDTKNSPGSFVGIASTLEEVISQELHGHGTSKSTSNNAQTSSKAPAINNRKAGGIGTDLSSDDGPTYLDHPVIYPESSFDEKLISEAGAQRRDNDPRVEKQRRHREKCRVAKQHESHVRGHIEEEHPRDEERRKEEECLRKERRREEERQLEA